MKPTERCKICDWPLAESREQGCVEGDCSYRPNTFSPEWYRIQKRRTQIAQTAKGVKNDAN